MAMNRMPLATLLVASSAWAQSAGIRTYANPIDVDYRYNFEQQADRPTTLELRALTVDQDYWVAIEAFDESGVSRPSAAIPVR
jgi:hypothetical protein